jgi:hypothetical protein
MIRHSGPLRDPLALQLACGVRKDAQYKNVHNTQKPRLPSQALLQQRFVCEKVRGSHSPLAQPKGPQLDQGQ